MRWAAQILVPGRAAGPVVALAPLSFWGGFDAGSGLITDRSHPAFGRSLTGAILVMPAGRGSSSSSSVLAEAIRRGTAPAALVLAQADAVLMVGSLVARTLYASQCPIVVVPPAVHALLTGEASLIIDAEGDEGFVRTSALDEEEA